MKNLSLLQKAFLSLVIVALPLVITFFITYHLNKTQIKQGILDDLTVIAEVYEGQLYQFMEMSKKRTHDFSSDGLITTNLARIINGDRAAVKELNEHLIMDKMPLDKSIHEIYVIASDGRIAGSTDPTEIGMDLSDREFFIKGKNGINVIEHVSGHEGVPEIIVSAPVFEMKTKKPIGVIVNFILLSELNKILSGEFTKERGAVSWDKGRRKTLDIYLVNADKLMITETASESNGNKPGRIVVDTPQVNACLKSNAEMTQFGIDYRGKRVAEASMCIPSMKWTLLVTVDEDEALAALTYIGRGVVITSIILAGLVGVLFVLYIREIVMPVRLMSQAALNVANGNYKVKVPVRSQDEVGGLSRSFNKMTGEIEAKIKVIQEGEARYRTLIETANDAIITMDENHCIRSFNAAAERIFGYRAEEVLGKDVAMLMPERYRVMHKQAVDHFLATSISTARGKTSEFAALRSDGSEFPIDISRSGMKIEGVFTFLAIIHDVTERKKAEAELKKLTAVIEQSVNAVFITDHKGAIEYVNRMFEQITGYSKDEMVGRNMQTFALESMTRDEYEEMWKTINGGNTWQGLYKHQRKNGQNYWCSCLISPIVDEEKNITHFLMIQEDVTGKRESEEKAEYLASHDELTGLYNRTRFMELVTERLSSAKGMNQPCALFLLDIDEFKYVNETYGHSLGDEFLRGAGKLLENTARDINAQSIQKREMESIAGCLGGDEFAILMPYSDAQEITDTAELLQKKMGSLYNFISTPVHLTVSMGIACYPKHGTTTRDLFIKADAAMFHAKELGRGKYHVYRLGDRDLEKMHSRLEWKERIQKAIDEDRFLPWFQPILDLKSDTVSHYEALARMQGEDGSIIMPVSFIDIAERFGIIGAIDRIIIEKTMRLQADKARHMFFGMNLSGKELGDKELLSFLHSMMVETGAASEHLIFEITETAAVRDMDMAVKFIKSLKSMGCHFSLDDFGVGFTSFVYLREMGVDYIKIDGAFIKNLHQNPHDQLFVKAIAEVAKGLGIKTIAEFVEREETIKLLKEYGVDYAQGYAIGKPVPWEEIKF